MKKILVLVFLFCTLFDISWARTPYETKNRINYVDGFVQFDEPNIETQTNLFLNENDPREYKFNKNALSFYGKFPFPNHATVFLRLPGPFLWYDNIKSANLLNRATKSIRLYFVKKPSPDTNSIGMNLTASTGAEFQVISREEDFGLIKMRFRTKISEGEFASGRFYLRANKNFANNQNPNIGD